MTRYEVSELPVVANGKLLGMISRSDLLRPLQARTEVRRSAGYDPRLQSAHAVKRAA
jgi:predicted transcriptional regulator